MATIHLMVGFMGFGKTTIAKGLAEKLPAVCLTHDDYMVALYGRNLPEAEFREKYKLVDNMLWNIARQIIRCRTDVIMDYGFWSKEKRAEAYKRALEITPEVVFHNILCDMQTAKKRLLNRSASDLTTLDIDENCFNMLSKQFEPIDTSEEYPIINHKNF